MCIFSSFKTFIISLSLVLFSFFLIAEETFCSSRYSFPGICENHFSNNIASKDSWIEAEDQNIIASLRPYLNFIPKCFEADCNHCFDCGGVGFNIYRGCDFPTDFHETLWELHTKMGRGLTWNCEDNSDHCEDLCWNGGYFRLWNHKYIHFFKHFLKYSSENKECQCYWPEIDDEAAVINNEAYDLLRDLADKRLILPEFSPYWKANYYEFHKGVKLTSTEYYPNSHGMASSLTTYTFFYSQYHQMFLSVISFIDSQEIFGNPKIIDQIYTTLGNLRADFKIKYNRCLKWHPHPKIYYERGMLKMHSEEFEDALTDINCLMRLAKNDPYNRLEITSEMYQQEGTVYLELGKYDQAIFALNEAIKLDSNNKGAYFNRAQAYFESGNFDLSIQDYLASNTLNNFDKTRLKASIEIKEAIFKGLLEGSQEALVDFFPTLCRSACGLNSTFWVFIEHPLSSTTNFVNTCYDISKNIFNYFKNFNKKELEFYAEEIQRVHNNFDKLSESEKAHFTAFLIGKYGIDIFAGASICKGIELYKNLKNANKITNFEALIATEKTSDVIRASALSHAVKKEEFFKNVKIHWDRQNKHVPGKHNYELGKSILTHTEPESLLRKHAGKGTSVRGEIGKIGYQEIVNFDEIIGYNVNYNEIQTLTTWGKIHYSKDGAHIVSTLPRKS